MNRLAFILSVLLCLGTPALAGPVQTHPQCLTQAYPDFWAPWRNDVDFTNTLTTLRGEIWLFDENKRHLPRTELLNQADLMAQMAQPYLAGLPATPPGPLQDPGRMRSEALFKALYGHNALEVQSHLVSVPWAPNGRSLLFHRLHGAAPALQRVGQALAENPTLAAYVRKPMGSFHWRPIAGTHRMSVHSFGAAVDFALPHRLGHYWSWRGCKEDGPCPYPETVLRDPLLQQVVAAFEKEGFIWGGKWAHFDTVHFEYRPELVGPSCKNVK
jgi:hypothetical protein